ncbi:MAG: DNA-3-methyladenine glycosylase family protein [Microthrixaceae bacterium]
MNSATGSDHERGPDATATLEVNGELDLVRTCRPLAAGPGDPTWRVEADRVLRSRWTPDGPATVEIRRRNSWLDVRAWGPGARAAVADAPRLVGLHDDLTGFDPGLHPVVARCVRRRQGMRMAGGSGVWDAVVPVVLGQRVTTGEAVTSWRGLVRRYGPNSPGPAAAAAGLRLAPAPGTLLRLGDADWHVLGVERKRADAIRALARRSPALERAAADGPDRLQQVLLTVPGVGPWTATGLTIAVLGDPDVVLLGDLHLPNVVCHALAGEARGDDRRMLELLAPWAGQRGRVARLLGAAGPAPRRGPRYAPLPISAW